MKSYIETILKHTSLTRDMKIDLLSHANFLTEKEKQSIVETLENFKDSSGYSRLKNVIAYEEKREKMRQVHRVIKDKFSRKKMRKPSKTEVDRAEELLLKFETSGRVPNVWARLRMLIEQFKNNS